MTVQTFRKRPVEVQAVQWTGDNAGELTAWTDGRFYEIDPEDRGDDPAKTGDLLDDRHSVYIGLAPGDWVVRLADGDVIAVEQAQFEAEYEPSEAVAS